jgi:hypothetical protein
VQSNNRKHKNHDETSVGGLVAHFNKKVETSFSAIQK